MQEQIDNFLRKYNGNIKILELNSDLFKIKTSFSGDNNRAEDVSQDTADYIDKSQNQIIKSNVILSSGVLSKDKKREEEAEREENDE